MLDSGIKNQCSLNRTNKKKNKDKTKLVLNQYSFNSNKKVNLLQFKQQIKIFIKSMFVLLVKKFKV